MEAKWALVTAVAPIAWGANYVVTRQWLPADSPLWGSALRALPAGLLLVLASRALPRGSWWWRSCVLGVLNVGAFFLLVYLAAQLLPSSTAASVMSLSPLSLALAGWLLLGERTPGPVLLAAAAGIAGVGLLLGGSVERVPAAGVLASLAALVMSSAGAVLGKRWRDGTPLLHATAWQLTAGGLVLLAIAALAEGPPPPQDAKTLLAAAFSTLVATALAFVCWFAGLARLPVATVGVVGLLNPVTGVGLGTLVAGESLTATQGAGVALTLAAVLAVAAGPRLAARSAARLPGRLPAVET